MNADSGYDGIVSADPLSEVRFVRGYIQFVFWPHTLSLYPRLQVAVNGRILGVTDAGFYDNICHLIGQKMVGVTRDPGAELSFAFSGGAKLLVSLRREHAVGEEIAMLADNQGGLTVERYDD
jgi:hypothetical protein